jgi:hypothetical protein
VRDGTRIQYPWDISGMGRVKSTQGEWKLSSLIRQEKGEDLPYERLDNGMDKYGDYLANDLKSPGMLSVSSGLLADDGSNDEQAWVLREIRRRV